ncbi:MAG TPA: MFS transporter [Pirellulales bacterium]|nr:MFS transporter [Pirellulales bacterium]
MPDAQSPTPAAAWHAGVSRYQWMVLAIASLGWIFDVFEGQIFVAGMNEAMPSLLPAGTPAGTVGFYNNIALGAFLLGGALGGVTFGVVGDRVGRTKTLIYTILIYSAFTCLSSLAQTWWQLTVLRFLVALGVGGEWAVATALVAEVFPPAARARSLGIFHASSVLGTLLAVAVGQWIIGNAALGWRWGFAVGAAPAVLTIWIRWGLREPDDWLRARQTALAGASRPLGDLRELFGPALVRRTMVGVGLAAVGLGTFWGVHIYGRELLPRDQRHDFLRRSALNRTYVPAGPWRRWFVASRETGPDPGPEADKALERQSESERRVFENAYAERIKSWEMFGMLLVTLGGGLGLVSFGPLSEWLGRRLAFLLFHAGGLAVALLVFQLPKGWTLHSAGASCLALAAFGFLTLGMHAGYAVYFPELFPTRLRGTGGGFCFNAGRLLVPPVLFASGWMQKNWEYTKEQSAAGLSLLFLVGIVLLAFAPETKGSELPE